MENDNSPMECTEPICTRCIHKNNCDYIPFYCNILAHIDELDIRTPFKANLTCEHFRQDIVLEEETK